MRIDLLDQQRLIVHLPGGDEVHLIDTSGSTTLEHHPSQGPVYSFLFPSPGPAKGIAPHSYDPEVQLEIPDLSDPPVELEVGQPRLFF